MKIQQLFIFSLILCHIATIAMENNPKRIKTIYELTKNNKICEIQVGRSAIYKAIKDEIKNNDTNIKDLYFVLHQKNENTDTEKLELREIVYKNKPVVQQSIIDVEIIDSNDADSNNATIMQVEIPTYSFCGSMDFFIINDLEEKIGKKIGVYSYNNLEIKSSNSIVFLKYQKYSFFTEKYLNNKKETQAKNKQILHLKKDSNIKNTPEKRQSLSKGFIITSGMTLFLIIYIVCFRLWKERFN